MISESEYSSTENNFDDITINIISNNKFGIRYVETFQKDLNQFVYECERV